MNGRVRGGQIWPWDLVEHWAYLRSDDRRSVIDAVRAMRADPECTVADCDEFLAMYQERARARYLLARFEAAHPPVPSFRRTDGLDRMPPPETRALGAAMLAAAVVVAGIVAAVTLWLTQ